MFVLFLFHSLPPSLFIPFILSPRETIANLQLKLDKYPHHHLSSPNLSPTESQYVTHRCTLLSHHFSTSFLSSFPPQLQKLDDTAGGISMVDAPDVDAAVFVRVLRDAGHVEVQGEAGVGVVELRRGDVWCVRWSAVREACLRGDVEMV
jgi:GINS complex subunit 4